MRAQKSRRISSSRRAPVHSATIMRRSVHSGAARRGEGILAGAIPDGDL